MQKEDIQKAILAAKANSPKRKFNQSVDMIVILRNLDLKKPEEQIDVYTQIPFSRGKPVKVCAIVGAELKDNAKQNCDFVILNDELSKYDGNKKAIKKLANEYTFFIAQAALMPQIAKVFGRVLGPKQKMPNPKAGCVVPPNANLKPLVDKLKKTVRLMAKTTPVIQVSIGMENQPEAELIENGFSVYNTISHAVKDEKQNVREVLVKLTMGKTVKLGAEAQAAKSTDKKVAKESPKQEEKPAAKAPEAKAEKESKPAKTEKESKPAKEPSKKKVK